ncbi:MAG: hypothetical protein HC936_02615 [Leptolyngbyaceae cyanobacterium SU_3_3]|nr:hypothetical protein [Leptolyngbyaceae cyanobacterium SU_3_3]
MYLTIPASDSGQCLATHLSTAIAPFILRSRSFVDRATAQLDRTSDSRTCFNKATIVRDSAIALWRGWAIAYPYGD